MMSLRGGRRRWRHPADDELPPGLPRWRVELWRGYVLAATILGLTTLPLAVPVLATCGLYAQIAVVLSVWLWSVMQVLRPPPLSRLRVASLMVMLYVLLVSFLVLMGPGGARSAWCLFAVVTATLLWGLRAALACVAVNAALLFGLRLWYGPSFGAGDIANDMPAWTMFVVNLSGLSVFAAVGVSFLLRRLDQTLRAERAARRELVRSKKLEAIGQVARGVAHDLGNMVQPVIAYARLLERRLPEDSRERAHAVAISAAAARIADLVAQILAIGRQGNAASEQACLHGVLHGLREQLAPTVPPGVSLELDLSAAQPEVRATEVALYQVFSNLVTNAVHAVTPNGRVVIGTQDVAATALPIALEPGTRVLLATVTDDGPGMDEPTAKRVFEPLFSTKGDSGTGLGLATARGIVFALGGVIELVTAPGAGTEFRVYLPLCAAGRPAR